MRNIEFRNGYYYHIYNRGTDSRVVFQDNYDYLRFLKSMREFNRVDPVGSLWEKSFRHDSTGERATWHSGCQEGLAAGVPSSAFVAQPLVKILCYVMMPNHFHLVLEQLVDDGISKYFQKLGGGYTNYFNKKYQRSGVLFQGKFKAKELLAEESQYYVSAYIHGNPEIHHIAPAEKWMWSSYQDYLEARQGTLCDKSYIMSIAKNSIDYRQYVQAAIATSIKRKDDLKEMLLEE